MGSMTGERLNGTRFGFVQKEVYNVKAGSNLAISVAPGNSRDIAIGNLGEDRCAIRRVL